ncbi:MAG: ParA family protein [Deltaproteobacteria bacterium]|nr:ParA family protein [Deltaproteobacteria bacterium]
MEAHINISVTGDKGGVGKSTIACLLAEWFNYHNHKVKLIDADPNQTTKTWLEKCEEAGRAINFPNSDITIVDTAGTSGSSLIKYIKDSDLILVPFQPHVSDLEIVVGWFLSLNQPLQERVKFIPNRLSYTKEQKDGLEELQNIINKEGRGELLSGLSNRPAVYPPFLNGSKINFFSNNLDERVKDETNCLFTSITSKLEATKR